MPTRFRAYARRLVTGIVVVRGAVSFALSSVRSGHRKAESVAHNARYVPLAIAAFGALLVAVVPQSRLLRGDACGDDSIAPEFAGGEGVNVNFRAFASSLSHVGEIDSLHPPVCARSVRRPPRGSACPFTSGAHKIRRVVTAPSASVVLDGRQPRNGGVVGSFNKRPCVTASICSAPARHPMLPLGAWWLLADNRDAPKDGRVYGAIPTAWITGLVSGPQLVTAGLPRLSPALVGRRPGGGRSANLSGPSSRVTTVVAWARGSNATSAS
jgi:hypothetical protein